MAPVLTLAFLWTLVVQVLARGVNRSALLPYPDKPRVFILSDISNEPDDQESLTRYLLYSNQFQTEGIVATTSTWLRHETHPEAMLVVMNAYGNVTENLNQHAPPGSPYPSGDHIRSLLRTGPAVSIFDECVTLRYLMPLYKRVSKQDCRSTEWRLLARTSLSAPAPSC